MVFCIEVTPDFYSIVFCFFEASSKGYQKPEAFSSLPAPLSLPENCTFIVCQNFGDTVFLLDAVSVEL